MTGVVELFSAYPSRFVERFLSVTTGIPAKFKLLPSIAEIREFCEEIYRPFRWAAEWEASAARHLAETEKHLAIEGPPEPPRPTLAELKEKYGENWGLKSRALDKNQPLTLDALAAKYGVSREVIDAIPDAKPIPKHLRA